MLNIKGIDKAELLAALYNEARPIGMGFLQFTPEEMTREQAAELLSCANYFDYVKGRPLKVDLGGEEMEEQLYDRDQGAGLAAQIVERLRKDAA